MTRSETSDIISLHADTSTVWNRIAFIVSCIVILLTAVHFWPMEGSRLYEMAAPVHVMVALWLLATGIQFICRGSSGVLCKHLPHSSLLMYIAVAGLSVAFALDTVRALTAEAKLILGCIGGYTLVSSAATDERRLSILYHLITTSLLVCVAYCLVSSFWSSSNGCGFWGNAFKYGTYTGMFTPVCTVWLLARKMKVCKALGVILPAAAVLSMKSLGGVASVVLGLVVGFIVIRRWNLRVLIAFAFIVLVCVFVLGWKSEMMKPVRQDTQLSEAGREDCKQRYIEWQALLNLLQERGITGTGIGCVNDYRSVYYRELPKLNTLPPYDQNGWLTTAAESGLLALGCFVWAIGYYFKGACQSARLKSESSSGIASCAACAGIAAAVVGNMFSSIQFSGVLIPFVVILALAERSRALVGERCT